MTRSRSNNVYMKTWSSKNSENYKKQRNFCKALLKKTKSEYFCNLNIKNLENTKKFWKKIKPFFSDNGLANNNKNLKKKKTN